MKKSLKKNFTVIFIVLAIIGIVFGIIAIKKHEDKLFEENRYAKIKDNVKNGVEWNISAQYPGCSISKEFKNGNGPGTFYNSSFLLNNGYIYKSELLDIDNVSYCDVYVDINTYFEDPLDHQKNCEIYYKIYLKCKNYEDKGYINWG